MKRLLRFWREFARRYRGWFLLGIVCLVATNLLTVAIPTFVQRAVDALAAGHGTDGALPWAFAVLGAGVGVIVVRTLSRTMFFNPGRTVEFRVKGAMFDRLLDLPQRFFDRMKPGDIISRGTNDTNAMRALIGFGTLQLFNTGLILLLTVGRMTQMNATLTLLCLGPLALAGAFMWYAIMAMFRVYGDLQAQVAALSERILEGYNGVAVVQAYNALPGAMARFEGDNQRLLSLGERLLRIRSWMLPVVSVTGNLCVVVVLYWGGRLAVRGELTVGELAAFIVYLNIVVSGLTNLGFMVGAVQRGYVSLGRIYEVLDAPNDRAAPTAALPPMPPGGYDIEVRDLTFTHAGAEGPSLRDLSFAVRPGETLGVFGLTGSGKSTLLDVLARIHDPPPGTVRLAGTDITTVSPRDYWRTVAYVGQEAWLFSRSVRENVALAEPPDRIEPARLQAAVEDAALAGDVATFPEGLDTRVGERGITLSGGQRQRTALARAFYRDFDVLLLDDVMSAVDHATEKKLIDAVYRRAAGCTTIIVSHRISVLARADRIIVLEDGRLVEEGTHASLLQRAGPYARAWKLQRAADRLEAAGEEAADV